MGHIKNFEELEIFQKARDLCKEIYAITKEGDFRNDSRFVQQIHASVGSVMDNIAEGFERDGNKEFIYFLYIASQKGLVERCVVKLLDPQMWVSLTATLRHVFTTTVLVLVNPLPISLLRSRKVPSQD